MKMSFVVLSALALGLSVAVGSADAFEIEEAGLTIGITPSVSSDYLFRGISQTRNRPAVQGMIDIEHTSGLYVAAFASNVAFAGTNARQELDVIGGYRFALGPVKLDIGGIGYLYPGYDRPTGGFDLNYFEVAAKASYEFAPLKVLSSAFYSPEFQSEAGSSVYLEGGLEVALPLEVTLAGRFGYQWIDRNNRYGTPDFANWNITLSRSFSGFVLTAGYYDTNISDTNISRDECVGGQKVCAARAMVTLSRTF
jgi:uncharacterized protein (TIGR02001 family)